jgi:hypothetical protein
MALEVEQLVREGAGRLLARATEARGAEVSTLAPRLRTTLDKYLLRHRPDASAREVAEFLDALRADELLLVWACERGDERAWEELIEQFRATLLSAARGASASESEA